MNFYDFLAKLGWLVEIGYAEKLDVERAGADSPVGPALVFDPTKPSSRKVVKKRVKAKKSACSCAGAPRVCC